MATITLQPSAGWQKLEKRLERYATDFVTDFTEYDARDIAHNHLEFAKILCPVRTGEMAHSLHLTFDVSVNQLPFEKANIQGTKISGSGFVSGDKTAQGGVSVASKSFGSGMPSFGKFTRWRYYVTTFHQAARYVEYGTMHAPAHPFMRPAYDFAKRLFRLRLRRYVIMRARGEFS